MQRGMTIKLRKTWLAYVVCLILYFRPAQYVIGSFLYRVTSWMVLVLFLVLLFFRFFATKRKPDRRILLLMCAYGWCMAGSTVINYLLGNKVSFSDAAVFYSFIGGLILLSDYGLKRNPKEFMSAFVCVGSIVCTLNALTMFIFKNSGGMNSQTVDAVTGRSLSTNYFLLAEDNATFFWTWPVIVIMWMYYFLYMKKKKYEVWLFFVTGLVLASYVYTWSVMAMLSFVLLAGLSLFYAYRARKPKKRKVFLRSKLLKYINLYRILFLISIVLTGLFVVGQISLRYGDFLETFLGKSATLSKRIYIWENAIYYIRKAPLIGYGYESKAVSITKLYNFNHTHNMWLEIFYRGGIIGGGLFFCAFWFCGKKRAVVSKDRRTEMATAFLYFAVFIFFVATIFEFAFYRYMYVVLFVLLIDKSVFEERKGVRRRMRHTSLCRSGHEGQSITGRSSCFGNAFGT